MGVVYLAEQREPVNRRVALKLMRWGGDSESVVARFESERQALALMSHPNIAQVFDAGTAPDGRPYFVMEFVQGVPITAYCDARKSDTRQRLELFMQVCPPSARPFQGDHPPGHQAVERPGDGPGGAVPYPK